VLYLCCGKEGDFFGGDVRGGGRVIEDIQSDEAEGSEIFDNTLILRYPSFWEVENPVLFYPGPGIIA